MAIEDDSGAELPLATVEQQANVIVEQMVTLPAGGPIRLQYAATVDIEVVES